MSDIHLWFFIYNLFFSSLFFMGGYSGSLFFYALAPVVASGKPQDVFLPIRKRQKYEIPNI